MKFNLNAENINYIKIIYKDSENFSHCIKAAIHSINEREIQACCKFIDNIHIKTPQNAELNFICDNGLYSTKTNLISLKKDEPYIFFTLQTPDNIEYRQNREFFRVKLKQNAKITYTTDRIYNIECETFDISANGVRLAVDNNIKVPAEVTLTLFLPKRDIKVKAKYIRTDDDDKIHKLSFCFTDIKDNDLNYISQICFQKQIEEKRKLLM